MSDIAQVEAAIRAAEEMMSRDMKLFHSNKTQDQDQPSKDTSNTSESSTKRVTPAESPAVSVSESNRYQDKQSREKLIQGLLQQRPLSRSSSTSLEELTLQEEWESIEQKSTERSSSDDGATARYGTSSAREELIQRLLKHRETSEQLKALREAKRKQSPRFRRKTLAELREEAAREEAKTCTFKPQISKAARRRPKEKRETVIDRLSKPKPADKHKCSNVMAPNTTSAKEQKELTFKPDVSKSKQSLSQRNAKETKLWQERLEQVYRNNVPVEERLHLDASERWAAREKARREVSQLNN